MKDNWQIKILIIMLGMILFIPSISFSRERPDTAFMRKMFSYSKSIDTNVKGIQTNVYIKYRIHTDRRNFTLYSVPTMYAIARGAKDYFGETYSSIKFNDINQLEEFEHISTGTIPHNRKTFPTLLTYLTPGIYDNTLFKDQILSPFNKSNHKCYKYNVTFLLNGKVKISYKPRVYNTQLVRGWALADFNTGQIISAEIDGEYDMIGFEINVEMGKEGTMSLIPTKTELHAKFKFLGNKLQSWISCSFCQPISLPDTYTDIHNRELMSMLRPEPLTPQEKEIYERFDSLKTKKDTLNDERASRKYMKMWEDVGDNFIKRLGTDLGESKQGYVRTSPILNPLYMSYSPRKGLTYRFDIDAQYDFNSNRGLNMNLRTGYIFKLKQFFFDLPLTFEYNKRRHAYIKFTIGSGNRITNSSILDEIKQEKPDSIDFSKMNLDYFKDTYMKLENNYDISDYFTVNVGMVYHRRSAVDKSGFEKAGRSPIYKSFAPALKLIYRPWKWKGPELSAEYERCLKNWLGSDMSYEKYEFDAAMKTDFKRLSTMSIRFGSGFYTSKGEHTYFLDYTNFRENNFIGGWNDEWTGDFQLLNSNWYNASSYYIRSNFTYEQPLLIATWLPIIGHLIEKERLYVNLLFVSHLNPYVEYGYGLTNRFCSIGAFIGTRNGKYDGFGCRFTIKLFRRW